MKNYFYTPSVDTTKFLVQVGGKAKVKFELLREGGYFYRIENEKKIPIGDYKTSMRFLQNVGAEWLVKKKNKLIPSKMFFNRSEAIFFLKQGYPLFSLDMNAVLVFADDYSRILTSDGNVLDLREVPPGPFCFAFNEQRLEKTFEEVQAERDAEKAERDAKEAENAAKRAAERKRIRKRLERERAVIEREIKAREAAIKRQDSARQEPAPPQTPSKGNDDLGFWEKAGIAAASVLLTGMAVLGIAKYNSKAS